MGCVKGPSWVELQCKRVGRVTFVFSKPAFLTLMHFNFQEAAGSGIELPLMQLRMEAVESNRASAFGTLDCRTFWAGEGRRSECWLTTDLPALPNCPLRCPQNEPLMEIQQRPMGSLRQLQ